MNAARHVYDLGGDVHRREKRTNAAPVDASAPNTESLVEASCTFTDDLHLSVLPPIGIWLRQVYVTPEEQGPQHMSCVISEPWQR